MLFLRNTDRFKANVSLKNAAYSQLLGGEKRRVTCVQPELVAEPVWEAASFRYVTCSNFRGAVATLSRLSKEAVTVNVECVFPVNGGVKTDNVSPSFLICETATRSFARERKREGRRRGRENREKETEEIPRKEMPIAAAGQPTTQEPRVCPLLPSTPEPVPKGADLFDEAGAAESAERTEYGGAEGGRGLGGYSYSPSGTRGFAQPGSIHGSPPQSPAASSSLLFHLPHPHQMAMEPPRTRSRSRSGYYQQQQQQQQYVGGSGNGITGSGMMGSSHHHHHHHLHQQQHQHLNLQQQQQHGAGCAPLGAHSNHSENQQRAPGSNASHGIQRLPTFPGAHRIPAAGKRPRSSWSKAVFIVVKSNREMPNALFLDLTQASSSYSTVFTERGSGRGRRGVCAVIGTACVCVDWTHYLACLMSQRCRAGCGAQFVARVDIKNSSTLLC